MLGVVPNGASGVPKSIFDALQLWVFPWSHFFEVPKLQIHVEPNIWGVAKKEISLGPFVGLHVELPGSDHLFL